MPGGNLQESRPLSRQQSHGKGPGGKGGGERTTGWKGEELSPSLFQSVKPEAVEIKA